MTAFNAEVEITSWHPGPFGGGVAVGRTAAGDLAKTLLPATLAARDPRPGERWRIRGRCDGERVTADLAMPLLPSGDAIVRWIASNPALSGIGRKTASACWDAHGPDLYRILRDGDAASLARTVPVPTATAIIAEFALLRDEVAVLEAFDRAGVTASVAMAACRLWGAEAVERLRADPYCVAALEKWRDVDARALRMGLADDDPRRLLAAIAEVMSARFRTRDVAIAGHTAATRDDIEDGVNRLLGRERKLGAVSFPLALERGELLEVDGLFQARAPWRMERDIEQAARERIARRSDLDQAAFGLALARVAPETGLTLSDDQRDAAAIAISSGFATIDGAAGTGKSTVTRAICAYADAVGLPYLQLALSGRAAKRLTEATGRASMTVHRFLKAVENGKLKLGDGFLLIDEISMLGIPELWQVLCWTPPTMDVVAVGDPGQLPPISAGNPLLALVASSTVPRRTLTVIRRQASDSAIPSVAAEIRVGRLPTLPEYDQGRADRLGVGLLRCGREQVSGAVLDVFESLVGRPAASSDRDVLRRLHGARVQVLGATRHGPAGVRELSETIERRWMAAHPKVHDWGLSHGSKLLWTRNSYDHPTGEMDEDGTPVVADVMNGLLGIVQRATGRGAIVLFDDAEGTRIEVLRPDLDRIERGWAITVHKAQGSAFDRVIMPIAASPLLDRLLIYTGVTRARLSVVLVGEEDLLARAVAVEPRSGARLQRLDFDAPAVR
ncbi:AAA family ATPase [Sphingomonas sp.]|uniref:AAA family ATPase n=1 Tax=Sphingomonas sp. TaxID=28214 RepID=UPI0035BBBD2D